jgi:hypothetical protein
MKWFAAGLTLVNIATLAGLILGILGSGLDEGFAGLALILGIAAAIWAWIGTSRFAPRKVAAAAPATPLPKSKRARRRLKIKEGPVAAPRPRGPLHLWAWAVGIVFALFAVRSFCWVLWIDGNNLKIQSPNNLGDLALHLTYIKYFANGVALWPDNPIYVFSKLRYPAGIDFFNSLLLLVHLDLIRVLVWTGLLGSVATFYAFYRWGGSFAVAGFLFNGGLAGFAFFHSHQFIDYQGQRIAWKSIPLTMFVTQRGLLYAIPAGLLLLLHWRRKYFPGEGDRSLGERRGLVPWWVEWSLYATMPFFHVHTFLALSGVLAFWVVIGTWQMRKEIALLFAAAFIPATWIVWMITDHFQAKSILQWAPGWLESDSSFSSGTFSGIVRFWVENFGLLLPAVLALAGVTAWGMWKSIAPPPPTPDPAFDSPPAVSSTSTTTSAGMRVRMSGWRSRIDPATWRAFAFVTPALGIFLFALLVKTAPWGWDNTKLMIWSYFVWLPFLWRELIARWPVIIRAAICFLLFFSGFVSLLGGLVVGSPGFDIANRTELNAVADAVKKLPIKERFASFPTFNHPLLLDGRKVVLGYPGHLWTQGFADYGQIDNQLRELMLGMPGWRERARDLHARYLFWGDEEKRAYAGSREPWKVESPAVASGPWGAIYDLERRTSTPGQQRGTPF